MMIQKTKIWNFRLMKNNLTDRKPELKISKLIYSQKENLMKNLRNHED